MIMSWGSSYVVTEDISMNRLLGKGIGIVFYFSFSWGYYYSAGYYYCKKIYSSFSDELYKLKDFLYRKSVYA
jgi:hypothetical protein